MLLLAISVLPSVFGGSIITANLPAGTAIVNINARQDGAGSYNGDQSLWYNPFFTGGATQLLEYSVQPGTYTFQVINPAAAAIAFPALTPTDLSQIYTAWTYNSPWITDYLVFDIAAASSGSVPQLFDGAPGPGFSSAAAAYSDAVANGYCNLIRPGPLGRKGTILSSDYTFTSATTLIFAVPDYGLYDNGGGISVVVAPVPEPTTAFLVLAFAGIGLVARKRRQRGT